MQRRCLLFIRPLSTKKIGSSSNYLKYCQSETINPVFTRSLATTSCILKKGGRSNGSGRKKGGRKGSGSGKSGNSCPLGNGRSRNECDLEPWFGHKSHSIASDSKMTTYSICNTCATIFAVAVQSPSMAMDADEFGELISDYKEEMGEDYEGLRSPKETMELLNEHVIGQQQAKKVLSVATYNHYKRLKFDDEKLENQPNEYHPDYLSYKTSEPYSTPETEKSQKSDITIEKSNILLLGPTGSGKTYISKKLADAANVAFSMSDATGLTQAGYVGDDIESIISKLLSAADGDVERAERGIVFLDEIDKIAARQGQNQRDVGGEGVQQGLLKMLEGTVVTVPYKNPRSGKKEQLTVDTSNILFVCSGAFSGMEKIIARRTDKKVIGFAMMDELETGEEAKLKPMDVTSADLTSFGMIPEFIGRLPIVVALHQLSRTDLVKILTEPKNAIVPQYQELVKIDNCELVFTADGLDAIADKAIANGAGARGLRAIIEKILLEPMFDVPKSAITKVTINGEVVRGEIPPIYEGEPNTIEKIGLQPGPGLVSSQPEKENEL